MRGRDGPRGRLHDVVPMPRSPRNLAAPSMSPVVKVSRVHGVAGGPRVATLGVEVSPGTATLDDGVLARSRSTCGRPAPSWRRAAGRRPGARRRPAGLARRTKSTVMCDVRSRSQRVGPPGVRRPTRVQVADRRRSAGGANSSRAPVSAGWVQTPRLFGSVTGRPVRSTRRTSWARRSATSGPGRRCTRRSSGTGPEAGLEATQWCRWPRPGRTV